MKSFVKIMILMLMPAVVFGAAEKTYVPSGPEPVQNEPSSGVSRSNKVLVDGFERANPYDFYTVREGDDSSLSLASSRLLHDGDYAMSLEYSIAGQNSLSSWVLAYYDAKKNPLDWTGVESVKFWVKGDGTDNTIIFRIVDADGETWSYEDPNLLRTTKWAQLSMPIGEFYLSNEARNGNQTLDLSKIQGYAVGVMNKQGAASQRSGNIYVDQLYINGTGLSAVWAAPASVVEKLRLAVSAVGNVDLSGIIYTEYFWSPEESQKMFHWGKILANAKVGDFSGRVEFASESQYFSDAAYIGTVSTSNLTSSLVTQSPKVISPSVQVMGNNLSPNLSNITIGNLFFDYNKYTFTGGWGWKGVTLEGDMEQFNYHVFYINQPYDSFASGTRWIGYFPDLKVTGYGVFSNETARIPNSGTVNNGNLSNSQNWEIKHISDDMVTSMELLKYFADKKIQVEAVGGWNGFNQNAVAITTDPYHPTYVQELNTPISYWDNMYKGKLEFNNLLVEDLRVAYEYRYVGKEFKPRYRQNALGFDESECDLKGYNISATQRLWGFGISAEYDDIKRLRNDAYYRFRSGYGLSYYGFNGMDVSFYVESRREQYAGTSTRSLMNANKNDKVNINELYVRNQLTPLSALLFKIRVEDMDNPDANVSYQMNSFYTKYEYYITSNAKFYAEYKTSKYPQAAWEPKGYPFDDNFARASFELTF